MVDPLLSPDELKRISGGYVQPAKQLEELLRQGFWRVRRARVTGEVILERAHYDAVCAGASAAKLPANQGKAPQLRPA